MCLLFLVGCGVARTVRVVSTAAPVSADSSASTHVALPAATSTAAPTQISTRVITQTATSTFTPSPTPTRTPTTIPTPTNPLQPTAALAPTQPPPQNIIEHVVIISIDGLRPDALELADTPVLDSLRSSGAYQPTAKTVVPSVTLISHASMLSGMVPQKHGIDWNVLDLNRGTVNGPTLFSVAHEAGLSTAMIAGKDKLEHLVLPGSVDQFFYAGFTDRQVTSQAIQVIQTGMPNVLFIHLPDVDTAGHLTGWMSGGQLLALSFTDGIVGEIVNQLQENGYFEKTLLIITSDHGGSGTSHGTASPEDITIPWLAVGPGVPQGVILENEIFTYDTAATAAQALNLTIPENWDGRPVLEVLN